MATKDSKRDGGERKERVTPEHRGLASKPGNGGVREGAGRKRRHGGYKTRNWATILYPESAAEGWRDILRGWCCQALLSPLHDKDKNPDETPKKPHYHLMVMWDGPKAQSLMEERFAELGGVGCQPCNSSRGMARYLCHMDNPEKFQYRVEDVEAFGGANYLDIIALESDRRQTIAEMCDWCDKVGCISFAELSREARNNHPVWWQALTSNSTMIMFRYVRSLEDEMKKGKFLPVEPEKKPEPEAEVADLANPQKVPEVARCKAYYSLSPAERAKVDMERAKIQLLDAQERLAAARWRLAQAESETRDGRLCAKEEDDNG